MADRRPVRSGRLDQPIGQRSVVPRPHYDPDAFGRLSERIARFLGTSRFLVYLTSFVIAWIGWNLIATGALRFDSYANKFTLLTLILSLQASYAAPLILLAQNRQADRDRISQEEDRSQNERLQADVEYLTREVASLRLSLGEVATRDFLRDQLRDLADEVVARSSDGEFDHEARDQRDERDRRAERTRRRAERPDTSGSALSQPFAGEPGSG